MKITNGTRALGLAAAMTMALALAGCTPPENEGGTPLPSIQSGAPLNDEAVGPSDEQAPVDGEDGG